MAAYRSEVGAIFDGHINYGANVGEDSPEQLAAFYERVNKWCERHGIVLGEGSVKIEDIRCADIAEHISYTLKAPVLEGPDFLIERQIC